MVAGGPASGLQSPKVTKVNGLQFEKIGNIVIYEKERDIFDNALCIFLIYRDNYNEHLGGFNIRTGPCGPLTHK